MFVTNRLNKIPDISPGPNSDRRRRVLIVGAGRIGRCIAAILGTQNRYDVSLADHSPAALADAASVDQSNKAILDVHQESRLIEVLRDQDVVVSACPYVQNPAIAHAALSTGTSYLDLTEDVSTTNIIRELASQARPGQVFIPQCGLAPGFVGILANSMARQFDRLDTLSLRVGALPQFTSNALMYNLTWSTEGLVNEYCNPCEAIRNGRIVDLQPLEGFERFVLDGMHLEAFNTSGGLGALCGVLKGRVRELDYKTIRYPGHRDIMDVLINTLRLGASTERRELLRTILESSIAVTDQDVTIVLVTAVGELDGKLTQISSYYKIPHGWAFGSHWSAIQLSTASALCVVLDLAMNQQLGQGGFVRQEDIPLDLFLTNPMAAVYADSARITKGHDVIIASV